jgi:hypothetical protein
MARLFLRRLSDIAPTACCRKKPSRRFYGCTGFYLNISTYRLSEFVGVIFIVSFRPGLVGRSWSENSCIIDVHGNRSVCNYRLLDGKDSSCGTWKARVHNVHMHPSSRREEGQLRPPQKFLVFLGRVSSWKELLTIH